MYRQVCNLFYFFQVFSDASISAAIRNSPQPYQKYIRDTRKFGGRGSEGPENTDENKDICIDLLYLVTYKPLCGEYFVLSFNAIQLFSV